MDASLGGLLLFVGCLFFVCVSGRSVSPQHQIQSSRATNYILDTVYFHLTTVDNLGANIKVGFKDDQGNVLSSSLLLVHKIIREINPSANNTVIQSYDNATQWSYSQGSYIDGATGGLIGWVAVDGNFPNGASIRYNFTSNEKVRNVDFAGEAFNLSAGGFKFQYDIKDWPFASVNHTLQIVYDITFTDIVVSSFLASNLSNILIPAVYSGGPDYLMRFRRYCLIDNTTVSRAKSKGVVTSADPLIIRLTYNFFHANKLIQYDPDLGAVFDSGATGSGDGDGSDTTLAVAIAVPVSVGVVALLAVVVIVVMVLYFYFHRKGIDASIQHRLAHRQKKF